MILFFHSALRSAVLLTLLVSLLIPAQAGGETFSLTAEAWKIAPQAETTATGEQISAPAYQPASWIKAQVPGTVFGSYVKAGLEKEPTYADNVYKVNTAKYDRSFLVSDGVYCADRLPDRQSLAESRRRQPGRRGVCQRETRRHDARVYAARPVRHHGQCASGRAERSGGAGLCSEPAARKRRKLFQPGLYLQRRLGLDAACARPQHGDLSRRLFKPYRRCLIGGSLGANGAAKTHAGESVNPSRGRQPFEFHCQWQPSRNHHPRQSPIYTGPSR